MPFSRTVALAAIAGLFAACGPNSASGPQTLPTTLAATAAPAQQPIATFLPLVQGASTPTIAGCPVFPDDNAWNRPIANDPVDPNSATYIASINSGAQFLHADFGANPDYGIPYSVVAAGQAKVPITFTDYADESDAGPYPIPDDAPVEAGSDRHVLVIEPAECTLYELFNASKNRGAGWSASSGAIFDLRSNALRPDTWTSADAAGLPIFAGLVRYDEVSAGRIQHALRFTVNKAQRGFVHPATHYGSGGGSEAPPMGARLRLKADYDISGYTGQARVVLEALKTYGMFVADIGTSWYISGATDSRWNDDDLDQLKAVPGSAFEVVKIDQILEP